MLCHYSFARAPATGRRTGHPRPLNRQHNAALALEEAGLQTACAGLHLLRRPRTPEKVRFRFPPLLQSVSQPHISHSSVAP